MYHTFATGMVVGYGRRPVKRTQDRGAACPPPGRMCNQVWVWVWVWVFCICVCVIMCSTRAWHTHTCFCIHTLASPYTPPHPNPQPPTQVTGLLAPTPDHRLLAGALVVGPDTITDEVEDYRPSRFSQVGIDNNAGFTGALAGRV